jgi:putative nucleotidyltransferase with HDIG domain
MKDRERVAQVLAGVKTLPTLPDVAMRLLDLQKNPNVSGAEMAGIIEQDMALTTRVLKLVNSPFFGLRYEVTSVQQAVVFVGMTNLRTIVIAGAVSNMFDRGGSVGSFKRAEFWKHSLAVAAIAKLFAAHTHIADPQIAFTAGLIHDMGKVVLDRYLHADFERIVHIMDEQRMVMRETELAVVGVDHAEIGHHLSLRWNLPEVLREAIGYHHDVLAAPSQPPMAALIAAADFAARGMNIGDGGGEHPPLEAAVLRICNLDETTLQSLMQKWSEALTEQVQALVVS